MEVTLDWMKKIDWCWDHAIEKDPELKKAMESYTKQAEKEGISFYLFMQRLILKDEGEKKAKEWRKPN